MLFLTTAHAEIKIIESDSTYIIGDNDSKVDARRIAVQEAKRKALELAGTFVASLTEVKNYELTKDEITAYTAGVIETEIVSEEMKGTAERPAIHVKTRCRIDTDVLASQIKRYQEQEELKEQLLTAQKENEALKKERDDIAVKLAAEKDKSKAEETRKRLDAILTREESNDETGRVWKSLAYRLEEANGPEINRLELDNSAVVLERAIKINPNDLMARALLAMIYQKRGEHAAAEKELRYAVDRRPDKPILHMKLGLLLKERGFLKDALREFIAADQLRPNFPRTLFHLGMTYKALGNCPEAISRLRRFVVMTKNDDRPLAAKARQNAVHALRECGDKPGKEYLKHKPPIAR